MPSASGTQSDPEPASRATPNSSPGATPQPGGPQAGAGPHPVLSGERAHLQRSREFLRLMREDVLSLRALGGDPVSQEYLKADLYRRAQSLRDLPDTPLFFGRLDYTAGLLGPGTRAEQGEGADDTGQPPGERFHIGRRHVHDPRGHPAVIDWRAPVSRPFYRASQADPMGLSRRRRFGFSGGELTAFEDEVFSPAPAPVQPSGQSAPGQVPLSRIMIDEIERPRSGAMRDIVATIQPEQDDIVRANAAESVCVQGAPGTGKTAVGLHRVAYLLYAHRERMSRGGVLVLGPNRAFLAYIRNVLPPLGEPAETIILSRGARRWRVPAARIAELVAELRERGVRYGTGRDMLSHRIAHVILSQMEVAGETCDDRTHEAVRRTSQVRAAVNSIWPKADP